ncbi:hypothetical protein H8356DRAFT_1038996 [Neocallimastix lanati (nom. inval.)]|uniref:UspA domain-containing protein n=1 Tax=Neocallimastix californiae TaxID=1754190 RepID=A0A1Y2B830_9FUNG|nr:hypothetical protein H8356DRAFT_1038996 [Neocallimastix sp. JGI-2020a]ORY30856.1 hypothetical protein LY90DRAFT_627240 [Neocallimastix californiae]|eukprot:ORY30856.1 hypothetical protein LY90DRAFT_627240 [Neocallimastix californiae]
MTKEDTMVSTNSMNEQYPLTKGSSEKNFTEKLGSKLKKTIKNSSNKIKKGLDKTTAAMESNSDHKNGNMDHDTLTEDHSESYDINYNDPYSKEHNASIPYKYNTKTNVVHNGNVVMKKEEEKKGNLLDVKNNNYDYYDEFKNYTTNKNSGHDSQAIPNYSEIIIENGNDSSNNKKSYDDVEREKDRKSFNGSDSDYITEKMKSLNMTKANNDSTYHQISQTLQSQKKPMYERAKDSAKEMMDTVIDKLTPNKKEKSYPTLGKDDEDDSHLKPGPYNAKDVHVIHSSTLPKYKSETDGSYVSSTNATVGSDTTTLNSNYDAQQASTLSAYMLAKNKREIELEKENKMAREKAEKLEIMEQDREKEWEREQEKEREQNSRYAVNWALNHFINKKNDLVIFINVRNSIALSSETDEKNKKTSHDLLKDYLKIYQDLNFSCRAIAMKGEPKEEIVRKANDLGADLLVMGSRGMGSFKKIFVGSVSEYCVNHAECPVLIVKNKPKNV